MPNESSYLVKQLCQQTITAYNNVACPCAFPRFRQIVGIDCIDYGASFACHETEWLIVAARAHYIIQKESKDDNVPLETWICPKYQSVFQYEWMDMSIHLSKQSLKPISTKIEDRGKPPIFPIPLYLGLTGHSLLGQDDIRQCSFEELNTYLLEIN